MKNTKKTRLLTQGYSLLELVLVLAIVSVLVGLLLPKGFDALRNARIQQVEKTVDTLKTALTDYLSMAGGNGSLPRTEGTGIPTSGAALTGATEVAKGNAARLDTVLLATGKIEKPLALRMGTQSFTSTGTGNEVTWSQAALGFVMLTVLKIEERMDVLVYSEDHVPAVAAGAAPGRAGNDPLLDGRDLVGGEFFIRRHRQVVHMPHRGHELLQGVLLYAELPLEDLVA